ncbi:MAG TPA: CDP-alcohol phosphatidyltransferase family protein, partial [Methanomassiliicoccales archaeon]|nr:CDP-alcohol phosphatidyltransferase family protein [Methanomassiliicoccales archaeon]
LPFAKLFVKWNPNTLSVISFLLAVLAAFTIFFADRDWQILLPLASVLILLSGLFDAIDGKVARLAGKASRRGDFVDHVLDRYSDVVLIGAVGVSSWSDPILGILALSGVLLTSYMGTQAQAVGAGRNYGGLLGRADRMVLLIAVPLVQALIMALGYSYFQVGSYTVTVFDLMMIWFAVVGHITAIQRAVTTYKHIR